MQEDAWYTMVQDFDGDWWVCPSDKVGELLMHLKWLYNNRKSGGAYNPDYAPCPKRCYPIGRPD